MNTFDDIFGQPRALDALRRAWAADRLPHGLIFAGPTGVGKATTARALAALFLCDHPNGTTPCGRCGSCTVFAAGNHPDYHSIYRQLIRLEKKDAKAKELAIDVIRDYLVAPAGRKPAMDRGKVFVIEEADLMNTAAQNSMLKTLEEPAGRTLIILLTDQPDALLPTIRSRSQLVRFAPLPPALVRSELAKRGVSDSDAADAAEFAGGSLGLALKWIEDGVLPHARELRIRLDAALAGRVSADFPDWLKAAAEQYAEKQQARDDLTSKDQATREGISLSLHLAGQEFRRHLAAAPPPESLEPLCAAIDALARAETYLDGNVNVPLVFQQLAVALERLFAPTPAARR